MIRGALDLKQARRKTPFLVTGPPADFVGRAEDLNHVVDAIYENGRVVIAGPMGVGKTSLAQRYADKYREDYPDGIYQLNANNEVSFVEKLAAFGRESGINIGLSGKGAGGPSDNLAFASLWAKEMSKPGCRALLIIDDIDDARLVTRSISGLPSLSDLRCDLLITTRNSNCLRDRDGFETVSLPALDPKDAVELLLTGLPTERQDHRVAREICADLGNTPVWLRLANARLLEPNGPSLEDYLESLRSRGGSGETAAGVGKRMLEDAWRALSDVRGGPRDLLMLLSILPLNVPAPYKLLALMIDTGDDGADEESRLRRVDEAVGALVAAGVAEQREPSTVWIHMMMHGFAAGRCRERPEFVSRALQLVVDRLHAADFYRDCENGDLVGRGEQLRLLRGHVGEDPGIRGLLELFDGQLDNLRNKEFDALAQLAMQSRLGGNPRLASVLEQVRGERDGRWFRLRWYGRHARIEEPTATGHADGVSAVAFWPGADGRSGDAFAVSGAENGEVFLWRFGPFRLDKRLVGPGPVISGLCVHPDGETVYATARDGSLRAIAVRTGDSSEPRVIGRHVHPANDCAIDPDGEFVVSVAGDGTVYVYDLQDGSLRRGRQRADRSPVLRCAVARHPESGCPVLITASQNGKVGLCDPLARSKLDEPSGLESELRGRPIVACALSPDGETAALVAHNEVLFWNIWHSRIVDRIKRDHRVADCCFLADGKRLVLVGRSKRVTVRWIDQGGEEKSPDPWYHWLTACACGPDGRIFFGSDDGSVHTFRYEVGSRFAEKTEHLPGLPNWINVFRAGGHHALSVSTDKTIWRWLLASGEPDLNVEGRANWVNAFAVSTDGEFVLSGTDLGAVIFGPLGARQTTLPDGFGQRANSCAISVDGETGLAGSEDGTLRYWSLREIPRLRWHLTDGHLAPVTACGLSADGGLAVSGGDDCRVVIWDLEKGAQKIRFEHNPGKGTVGHAERITAAVFAHGRPNIVLSSSWDGTVKCWDIESGQLTRDFREHTDSVTSCGTAADGVVFSASLDRTLRRWSLARDSSDMRIHLPHRLRGLMVDPTGDWVLCGDMAGMVYRFDVIDPARSEPAEV